MVWAEVAGVAGAAAGAAEGRAGAWRTRFCAVAQVATQWSWPLVWAWIRPSVPSWAITRTEIPRSVTVQCLLGKNYNCWRGGSGLTIRRRLTICPTKAPGCLTELGKGCFEHSRNPQGCQVRWVRNSINAAMF